MRAPNVKLEDWMPPEGVTRVCVVVRPEIAGHSWQAEGWFTCRKPERVPGRPRHEPIKVFAAIPWHATPEEATGLAVKAFRRGIREAIDIITAADVESLAPKTEAA